MRGIEFGSVERVRNNQGGLEEAGLETFTSGLLEMAAKH